MIVPLAPNLEGLAERRFLSFARQVLDEKTAGDSGRIGALVEAEATRAAELREIKGQCDEYTACVRVLGDLAQLRWTLVESGYGLELHSPRPRVARVSDPAEGRRRKEAVRNELRPRVLRQLSDANVRKFIRRMERPPASSGWKSVRTLIADGVELQGRLSAARQCPAKTPARVEALRQAVRPYLQLVDANLRDDRSGLSLRDIWRYFRYSWSIPQTPIPGRNLHYLVRDAAHEAHAVIGIAALSNCAVQVAPRDRAIGWSVAGLVSALETLLASHEQRAAREASDPALRIQGIYQWMKSQIPADVDPSPTIKRSALGRVIDWLLQGVSAAIGEIEWRGLASDEEIAVPTPQVVERLRHQSRKFASLRQEALAGGGCDDVNAPAETISSDVPIHDELLDLEAKHSSNTVVHNSRRMLVRKKRAFELARLLDARRVLAANRLALTDPATVLGAMEREDVRAAIHTAMSAIKGCRIGTNLLEITTCGAIAPYNRMLGGKLVALLLLSPQVATDYHRRYGKEPTIIRSQLKNARVIPDNTLVWLGTTSLFSHGSSQYERLRLPAGVIAPSQPELRYTYLGNTSGYGTVQFADDTVRALEGVLRRKRGYRDVNGVFGEGASPRLRKLRSGLDAIGLHADLTMVHHQERRLYGVPLFAGAGAYLCGLEPDLPDYLAKPETCTDATGRIAEFWRQRWLSRRLAHDASWNALGETRPWSLSSTIPMREPPPQAPGGNNHAGGGGGPDDERWMEFWRRLARAGSNAVSEGLTTDEFDTLHIRTSLEDYLLDLARDGHSIVLTGNAGDGKTHLARALQRRLKSDADRFEFAFDATAIMNSDDGAAPVVERWRQAENAGKRMVLAINQYPLYLLRRQLPAALPHVSAEIERQWKARLISRPPSDAPNDAALVLVDLSLRNPLSREFADRILDKMLRDPAVQRHANRGDDPNFSFNFERLAHPMVRDRLFELFDRVIASGRRTTVRELWILTARLLFGASATDEAPGAPQAWYSERLFHRDSRFLLSDALCSAADPASVSHPHVDRWIENPAGMRAGDWLAGNEPPASLPSPVSAVSRSSEDREKYRARFIALKRRFYFEHVDGGGNIFKLDHGANADFHTMLRKPDQDTEHLSRLIEAINRCCFPHHFDGIRDRLCLWIGHRLDEQPTKSFVADEYIPRERLRVLRPEPPGRLKDALAYVPDHLLIGATGSQAELSPDKLLRVDTALFRTLWTVLHGLPRHLVNPVELNRLDTFVDRLRRHEASRLPEFLIYNAEHVASGAVKMSTSSAGKYLAVRRL